MLQQQEILVQDVLKVVIESENVANDTPARVLVYFHGRQIAEVVGHIVPQSGYDQIEYSAIQLDFAP